MKKALLLIPFLTLLGVSCSGGHITTTPVVKNAPSAVLGKPTKKTLIAPQGYEESVPFTFSFPSAPPSGSQTYYKLDGSLWKTGESVPTFMVYNSGTYQYMSAYWANGHRLCITDYVTHVKTTGQVEFLPNQWTPFGAWMLQSYPCSISGVFHFKPVEHAYTNGYDNGEQKGYQEGREEGYTKGYEDGKEDGYYTNSNKLIPNGMYTGLTIFPRRQYLENYAEKVISGKVDPENGQFYLNDTNGNYAIEMKWTYNDKEKITSFYSYGDTLIGELDWHDVAEGYWNSTWFGKYDAELHHFTATKTYATKAPIETSFYPEVYLGSTFTGGDANFYFAGGGNDYQMGFADGQTKTIQASDTYKNVFTIFTPAFRAVADFFNLNIGPFKVWYFFAIPLIVTLLILVLRLVKH